MKSFIVYSCFTFVMLCTVACNDQQRQMNNDQPQTFNTPEEAIKKAKEDLLAVLRANKEINVGVDVATLEKAQPGPSVRQVVLNFDQLITADSASDFSKLIKEDKSTVVPMIADNNVVTIVEVTKDDKGWKVTSLAAKDIADDLSVIRRAIGDTAQQNITIYEVPNLRTRVYGVRRNNAELFYTNYGDRFNIREGVQASQLIQVLKADAIEFQRKYGDLLKKEKLVE